MRRASHRSIVALALALALAAPIARPAAAQSAPCDACARGDALIERFSLEAARPLAGELAALALTEPLAPAQYVRVIELRRRAPALVRLGALDDADLALVAAALCGATSEACTAPTVRALRCLADRCEVALPEVDPRHDRFARRSRCPRRGDRMRSPPLGLGFDWATGWQRGRHPSDGHGWSFGIETRLRLGPRLGVVGRVDRVAGRDEAIDLDGDGRDDLATGPIVRVAALAGPSLVLHRARFEEAVRSIRLDVLGGYLATRSQPDERGPAAGLDLAFQLSIMRAGVRVVQGFGGARDATMVLAHLGVLAGAAPQLGAATCGDHDHRPATRLAIGVDVPTIGYGLSSELGVIVPGLGVEALWKLRRTVDALARADYLLFPRGDRERVLHQAVLAGVRVAPSTTSTSSRSGFFATVLGGYSLGAGPTPTAVGSGPVVDLAVAWSAFGSDAAASLRLHGRFGVSPDNVAYRALFLSLGFELRLDPRRWGDGY